MGAGSNPRLDTWPSDKVETFLSMMEDLLRKGMPERRVAEYLGISKPTWDRLKRFTAENPYYYGHQWREFAARYRAAKIGKEDTLLTALDAACDPDSPHYDHRAVVTRLRFLDKEAYSESKQVEVSVKNASDDELQAQIVDAALALPRDSEAWQMLLDAVKSELLAAPVEPEPQPHYLLTSAVDAETEE